MWETASRLVNYVQTREGALAATERLSAAVNGWASLEHLANAKNRSRGGFNDWEILEDSGFSRRPMLVKLRRMVAKPGVVTALHCMRIGTAVVHLLPIRNSAARGSAAIVSTATSALLAPLHQNGGDGSDQVGVFTQGTTAVARLFESARVTDAVLWGVASQATLAYLVSGWVKLMGKPWRDGTAISGVMRTRTYGAEPLFRLLQAHPQLGRLGEIGTLVIECAYPVVYALHPKLRLAYIGGVASMHAGIAVVMGLGRFFPAFLSLQPSVLYTAAKNGSRDNTMLRVLACATCITAAALAVMQVATSRKSRQPRPGQHIFKASRGTRLAVDYRPASEGHRPLLIFENSLVAVQEYWSPLLTALGRPFATLTYDRPGYGASTNAPRVESLDSYDDDLSELIEHFGQKREVWLIGHSLGGYLVQRAAAKQKLKISGLILLDPTTSTSTNPDDADVDRTALQSLVEGFPLMEVSLRSGGAPMLNPSVWSIPACPEASIRISSVYRNHRIWRAGREEWTRTVDRIISERTGETPGSEGADIPTLVITASTSVTLHPVSAETHRNIADNSRDGKHVVVQATHDGMLTDPKSVPDVANEINKFIESNALARSRRAAAGGRKAS